MRITIDIVGGGLAEKVTVADLLERNLRMWGLRTTLNKNEYRVDGFIDERMENLSARGIEVEINVFHTEEK